MAKQGVWSAHLVFLESELAVTPAAFQIWNHPLPVEGGPEGADGCGRHGGYHSDHGCTLTCLKQSDLDSTKGAFGDLCLQNCEELEEIFVSQPWMLLPASGTLFRRSHLWGSPGFHCPAAPWSAGHWRSHPALHFYSFPKLLPQTIL